MPVTSEQLLNFCLPYLPPQIERTFNPFNGVEPSYHLTDHSPPQLSNQGPLLKLFPPYSTEVA